MRWPTNCWAGEETATPLRRGDAARHDALVRAFLALLAGLVLGAAALAQQPNASAAELPPLQPGMQRFYDRGRVFRVDLPEGWRQLAPREVAVVEAAVPDLPRDIRENEPSMYFAIGAVEEWRKGTFDGRFLYVVYQDNEWQIDGDIAAQLQELWRKKSVPDGVRYEVAQVAKAELGPDRHPAITCVRTSTPARGGIPLQSLDVYVPSGGMQLSLSFTCFARDFAQHEASLRAMANSLGFARRAKGEAKPADRMWTPILVGAVVGLVLVFLYRSRRRV